MPVIEMYYVTTRSDSQSALALAWLQENGVNLFDMVGYQFVRVDRQAETIRYQVFRTTDDGDRLLASSAGNLHYLRRDVVTRLRVLPDRFNLRPVRREIQPSPELSVADE